MQELKVNEAKNAGVEGSHISYNEEKFARALQHYFFLVTFIIILRKSKPKRRSVASLPCDVPRQKRTRSQISDLAGSVGKQKRIDMDSCCDLEGCDDVPLLDTISSSSFFIPGPRGKRGETEENRHYLFCRFGILSFPVFFHVTV
ncbi:hypothetical protein NDU88_001328 [Pleurodeles waltl]|uniref:Uncharacterized protein n=1 Tax=Pleurodeles waltl TaxID=8319 RepID=A0AAV7RCA2_PLEWA|nr:hypothetical protein NDU88_001328 [Pleurodeles waltl]